MDVMFMDARAFDQDLSGWNFTSVIQMGGILASASSFNQNLCNWGHTLQLQSPDSGTENVTAAQALRGLFSSRHASFSPDETLFPESGCVDPTTPVYADGKFEGPLCQNCSA
jgi:hypothetical protein